MQNDIAAERLKSFIERIERLSDEKTSIQDAIKDVYAESKGVGFEPKIIRKIVKIRKMDKDKRAEEDHLLDLYRRAIGV
jgi:uncharacterized protein (UPF0335 family)